MQSLDLLRPFRDTRGVAMISAVIALMLLSALLIVFAVLARTEPTIASIRRGASRRGRWPSRG